MNEYVSSSNILKNVFVELWGEVYSIEYTTELDLSSEEINSLGSIPQ